MKEIKIEWCENWIRKVFGRLPEGITGIECNLFWSMAVASRLYIKGTYGSPMTQALEKVGIVVDSVANEDRTHFYNVFRLN